LKLYLYIAMHDGIVVKKINSLADLTEQLTDERFRQLVAFDLLEKGTAVYVLKHHVGDVPLLLQVVV